MQECEDVKTKPKDFDATNNSKLSLYTLLIQLKDTLAESSVPATTSSRGDESLFGGSPSHKAGDGVYYIDKILKTYFRQKNKPSEDGWESCSSSNSSESPVKKKQERLVSFFRRSKMYH